MTALMTNPPPPTPVDPVTEVLHGVAVTDHYRWLEDQNCPRTRKWLEAQIAYTRAYFDSIPSRDHVRNRIEELLTVDGISHIRRVGSRSFIGGREDHQQQAVSTMKQRDE